MVQRAMESLSGCSGCPHAVCSAVTVPPGFSTLDSGGVGSSLNTRSLLPTVAGPAACNSVGRACQPKEFTVWDGRCCCCVLQCFLWNCCQANRVRMLTVKARAPGLGGTTCSTGGADVVGMPTLRQQCTCTICRQAACSFHAQTPMQLSSSQHQQCGQNRWSYLGLFPSHCLLECAQSLLRQC